MCSSVLTALTEADEFMDIYNLEVVEVPTNRPMIRDDQDDEVYRTAEEKYRAIITLIEECKIKGQPVLVGTTSIEKSEQLAEMLRQQHRVLGAVQEDPAFGGNAGEGSGDAQPGGRQEQTPLVPQPPPPGGGWR